MKNFLTRRSSGGIPMWVNLMQAVLIMFMAVQVYAQFFDHEALAAAGIRTDDDPSLNVVYEMGARLIAMIAVSVYVIVRQNPLQYLVVLIMNVVRESLEGIIDPLYPIANAPMSPLADFLSHLVIVAVEVAALVTVARLVRRQEQETAAVA